ncbi:hypothetical protein CAOG_009524 [Capsaspora owczarzaki ATCC 30864]|uniref:Uncharacterized protein n=1 Tax=Capsaspora owczarzaki (strain ATCC 30864) TaxID=595528 RepID=A0A0D2U7Q0_CAPO3|nr:hypothetical protein CAOG_009524 [Capsaspora owczarzaki ATCC 30864]
MDAHTEIGIFLRHRFALRLCSERLFAVFVAAASNSNVVALASRELALRKIASVEFLGAVRITACRRSSSSSLLGSNCSNGTGLDRLVAGSSGTLCGRSRAGGSSSRLANRGLFDNWSSWSSWSSSSSGRRRLGRRLFQRRRRTKALLGKEGRGRLERREVVKLEETCKVGKVGVRNAGRVQRMLDARVVQQALEGPRRGSVRVRV